MVAITAFWSGVQQAKCAASFHKKRPAILVELSKRVGRYIDTKEFLKTKDSGFTDVSFTRAKRKCEGSDKGPGKKPKPSQQRGDRDQAPMTFTLLSHTIQEVIVAAKTQNLLKKWGQNEVPSLEKESG